MRDRRRIPGNPGSAPISTPAPSTQPSGSSPAEPVRKARLVVEGSRVYVVFGSSKIELDDVSTAQVLSGKNRVVTTTSADAFTAPDELKPAIEAAQKHRDELMKLPGVISVRAGYKFINGVIRDIPCVVVAVNQKMKEVPANERIPAVLEGGIPTDVTVADPYERLAHLHSKDEAVPIVPRPRLLIDELQAEVNESEMEEALPAITYEPPRDGNLEPITDAMTLMCHVSPDAGWRILEPFLKETERELHLGMYDFTAPHIYQTVRSVLRGSEVEWQQVLDPKESLPAVGDVDSNKANDVHEADVVKGLRRVAGNRFRNAFAHIGSGKTVATAYHIKVAVRDGRALWLSSGNWQSSNQPDIDFLDDNADRSLIPKYNREWHVVVANPTLAKRLQCFLDSDFKIASTTEEAAPLEAQVLPDVLVPEDAFFEEERATLNLEVFPPQKFVFTEAKPLTIQPILTPDNYLEIVLELLRKKPKKRLYFQNQSLNPIKDPSPQFAEMMRLLADYSRDRDLDARFIFRNIGPMRKKLESLKAARFNMARVRMQAACHTKGIVIDSETVMLGSHNFTNQGVQVNRDASLLLRHEGIAKYYEKVFLHDWDKLSRDSIREEATPVPIVTGSRGRVAAEAAMLLTDSGMIRLPWSSYEEE